jgi:hypothetical protein
MAKKLSTREALEQINKKKKETQKETDKTSNKSTVNDARNNTSKLNSNSNTNNTATTARKLSTREALAQIRERRATVNAHSPTVAKPATAGGTSNFTSSLDKINSEIARLTADFNAKESKYTDDYWQSRLDEAAKRREQEDEEFFQKYGYYNTNTGGGAWGEIDAEKKAWNTERASIRKQLLDLNSMKKVYEGVNVLSAPDFNE